MKKKQHEYIQLEKPQKFAMVEHSIILEQSIQLYNTSTLSRKPRYMECTITEANEAEVYPKNTVT
jgi:hypothetical protein